MRRHGLPWALATVAGLGDRLPAPGTTVGSLVGAVLFGALCLAAPAAAAAAGVAGTVLLVPVAVWACGAEARRRGVEDPGAVVLDEVAGQWLALTVVALLARGRVTLPLVAGGFVAFRVFDVLKPWPVRALERLPGGVGIVADDLAAGLAAGLVEVLLLAVI